MSIHGQMRTAGTIISLLATGLALGPASVAAQATSVTRHGFYGSAGIGYGSEAVVTGGPCSSCPAPITGAVSAYLAAGWTLAPSVRVGAEVDLWTGSTTNFTTTQVFTTLATAIYPTETMALWIKINAGIGNLTSRYSSSTVVNSVAADVYYPPSTGTGFALGGGMGYDIAVGPDGFAVIPHVGYLAQFMSTGKNQGLFQIGFGFGYRH